MSKDFFVYHHHHHLGLFGYTLLDIRTREGREGEKEEEEEEENTNKEHFHPRLSRTKVGIFGRK